MAPAHSLGLPGPSVRGPRTPDHPPPGWRRQLQQRGSREDTSDSEDVAPAPAAGLGELALDEVRESRVGSCEAAQKRMAILDALDDEITAKARKITELQNELGRLQHKLDETQKKDKETQTDVDVDKKSSHESSSWRPKPSRPPRGGQAAPTPKMLQATPKAGASASSVLFGPDVPPVQPVVIGARARSGKDSK